MLLWVYYSFPVVAVLAGAVTTTVAAAALLDDNDSGSNFADLLM